MKTLHYKIISFVAFMLLCSSVLSGQEVQKEYHREYDVEQGDLLELDNRYGDIIVTTGNVNSVIIDVVVTLSYPDMERAEKLMSYIDVVFLEQSGRYSARTTIDDRFSFTGWGRSNKEFDIRYTVSVPTWIDLTVTNKYGDVSLAKLDGRLDADLKYGNLKSSGLTRGNIKPVNSINISYGNVEIVEVGWLDFVGRYASDINIEKAQAVAFDTKYSKVSVAEASSLVIESKYDKYKIGHISNLIVDAGYSDYDILSVSKKMVLMCKYGTFSVGSVPAGFDLIEIDADYTGITVLIDDNASYEIDAEVSYGKITVNEDAFTRQRQIISNHSEILEGTFNSHLSSKTGKVIVDVTYGNVRLYR